ncbi:MAG: LPXTG cell wall anchor domain-containing protein, partial [Oscillospiraceae bacterium]
EIQGLKAGTYYLEEVQAPDGFNKIAGRIAININDNGLATIDNKEGSLVVDGDTPVFAIVNNTGAELPSTGGIGTTIFYVVGGILMLGAAVILVTRKKVSSSK